jgi:hypothetical protein
MPNPYFALPGENVIYDNKGTTCPALQITIFIIICISPAHRGGGHAFLR